VVEAFAEELKDKDTAKLAREYRRQEERVQAFVEKQIPVLVKEVIKTEVPKDQREPAKAASSSRTRTRSRSTTSRSTRSSSSGNGRTSASRSRASSGRRSS
jgi:hypothetical protein